MTHGQSMQPERRVRRVSAPHDPDAELEDRQERAANGMWMARPGVEVVALDEQDRGDRLVADPSHLSPEAPAAKRAVEIGNRLALDEDSAADSIVAGHERLDRYLCAKPLKSRFLARTRPRRRPG
jgi:hypothetical protein